MKRNFFRLMAIAILAMGMTLASCEKDPADNPTPGGNNGGNNGGGNTPASTIVVNNFATPLVINSEGSVAIEGNELMIAAWDGTCLLEAYGGVGILSTPDASGYDYDKVTYLNEGAEIGSSSHFTQDGSVDLYSQGGYEAWANKTGYAGITFKKDGKTVYGWAKIKVDASTTSVYIYGYAYEATAGKSIKAGAVK